MHDKALWPMVLCFLLLSVIDILGISLIGPYLSIIFTDNDQLTHHIENYTGLSVNKDSNFLIIICFLLIIILCKLVLSLLINYKIINFSRTLQLDIRVSLMNNYLNLSYTEYCKRNSSDYIYNLQTLVTIFCFQSTTNFLKLISESVVIFSILYFLRVLITKCSFFLFFLYLLDV